jgi:dynein light intermediate chain 2
MSENLLIPPVSPITGSPLTPLEQALPVLEEKVKVKVDPNKDLWQNIALNVKEAAGDQTDQTVLLVGAKHSGKTSLVNRMLNNSKGSAPTTALEYSYGKREERNVTNIAHFWELAQGTDLAQLSDVVITGENVHTAVVTIVVDCSNPGTIWETLHYWLLRIDRRVQEIFQKMRAKGSSTPDKLLTKAKKRIGEDHPDLPKLRVSGIPTLIVANKLDKFKGDLPKLKLLARTLRYLAHLYGSSLIFTSTENERETAKFLALFSNMIFGLPLEAKHIQLDPEKGGVLVPAGSDSFRDIGEPSIGRPRGFQSCGDSSLDSWKGPLDEAFEPISIMKHDEKADDIMKGFEEPSIDAMRKQKDDELEQYRRNAAKKAAEEKAAATSNERK